MAFRSTWEDGSSYLRNDVVVDGSKAYICTTDDPDSSNAPSGPSGGMRWAYIGLNGREIAALINALTGDDQVSYNSLKDRPPGNGGGSTNIPGIISGIEMQTGDDRLSATSLKDGAMVWSKLPTIIRSATGAESGRFNLSTLQLNRITRFSSQATGTGINMLNTVGAVGDFVKLDNFHTTRTLDVYSSDGRALFLKLQPGDSCIMLLVQGLSGNEWYIIADKTRLTPTAINGRQMRTLSSENQRMDSSYLLKFNVVVADSLNDEGFPLTLRAYDASFGLTGDSLIIGSADNQGFRQPFFVEARHPIGSHNVKINMLYGRTIKLEKYGSYWYFTADVNPVPTAFRTLRNNLNFADEWIWQWNIVSAPRNNLTMNISASDLFIGWHAEKSWIANGGSRSFNLTVRNPANNGNITIPMTTNRSVMVQNFFDVWYAPEYTL